MVDTNKEKEVTSIGGLTIEVTADTDSIVKKCRTISKHLTALADELENIDKAAGE